jgi:hypothetical protein
MYTRWHSYDFGIYTHLQRQRFYKVESNNFVFKTHRATVSVVNFYNTGWHCSSRSYDWLQVKFQEVDNNLNQQVSFHCYLTGLCEFKTFIFFERIPSRIFKIMVFKASKLKGKNGVKVEGWGKNESISRKNHLQRHQLLICSKNVSDPQKLQYIFMCNR